MKKLARNDRDTSLEALRGLAALAVVAWHLTCGFFPAQAGIFKGFDSTNAANGHFWFGLMNGGGAVHFFFFLSGFVLTSRALAAGDGVILVRGALKRWPRLAGPIALTILLSYALFRVGAYAFVEAGNLTGSPWLTAFAYASGGGPRDPSLIDALKQGIFFTLFRGDESYDSSLWTMVIEFRGSFLAFAFGLALLYLRNALPIVPTVFCAIVIMVTWQINLVYLAFVFGVVLAAVLANRPIKLPLFMALGMCGLGLYFAGYTDGRGDYRWIVALLNRPLSPDYVHIIGSAAVILAVEGSTRLQRMLSGPWASVLGRLSFPIYLVHVLVICSAGSRTFLALFGTIPSPWPELGACFVTVFGTLAIASPLVRFDIWWMQRINEAARWAIPESSRLAQETKHSPAMRIVSRGVV